MEAVRPNVAEFDLSALRHNMRALRAISGPEIKYIAALKANAYGHGAAAVARTLAEDGDTFALATGSFEDALAIRNAGVELPIMMFGGALPEAAPLLVEHDLMPTVYDRDGAQAASDAARAAGRTASVYVKVDAGLGRLGVPLPDALEYLRELERLPGLHLEGVYTHLSFYDEAEREWARGRMRAFDGFLRELGKAGIEVPVTQALASSCMVAGLTSLGNAVCPGHLLYGVPSVAPAVADTSAFRPVLRSIRSRLIHAGTPKAANAGPAGARNPGPDRGDPPRPCGRIPARGGGPHRARPRGRRTGSHSGGVPRAHHPRPLRASRRRGRRRGDAPWRERRRIDHPHGPRRVAGDAPAPCPHGLRRAPPRPLPGRRRPLMAAAPTRNADIPARAKGGRPPNVRASRDARAPSKPRSREVAEPSAIAPAPGGRCEG